MLNNNKNETMKAKKKDGITTKIRDSLYIILDFLINSNYQIAICDKQVSIFCVNIKKRIETHMYIYRT